MLTLIFSTSRISFASWSILSCTLPLPSSSIAALSTLLGPPSPPVFPAPPAPPAFPASPVFPAPPAFPAPPVFPAPSWLF